MALARVVTFEGVNKARMDEMDRELQDREAPKGFPPTEMIVLHDQQAEEALVVILFDSEDDYRRGDEILNAMPAGDTPGRRTAVRKYDVATRMKSSTRGSSARSTRRRHPGDPDDPRDHLGALARRLSAGLGLQVVSDP